MGRRRWGARTTRYLEGVREECTKECACHVCKDFRRLIPKGLNVRMADKLVLVCVT
jgi:hypothetical protein